MMEVHFNGSFMGLYGVGLSVYNWHVIELMTMISEVASLYTCNDGSLISSQYPQSAINVFLKLLYMFFMTRISIIWHVLATASIFIFYMRCSLTKNNELWWCHPLNEMTITDPWPYDFLFQNQYFGSFVSVVRPCIDSSLWSLSTCCDFESDCVALN